jgi:hypothetical protein
MRLKLMNAYFEKMRGRVRLLLLACAFSFGVWQSGAAFAAASAKPWRVGTPIVTYWAGPAMSDATLQQMRDGNWNLVWCGEKDLDLVHRYGLRAQLQDPLLSPASLRNPGQLARLDALIERVRKHPALYSYFITDEPSAKDFPGLGELVAYLRWRDPGHLAYINLFPTYANNDQLGTRGDTVTAYKEHLDEFIRTVKPGLISYDHYQFSTSGDSDQYFLNLAMIRHASQEANLPFLNIVQACTWTASMRVPTPDEMSYLVYTTLAYGAQGISYYVYCHPGHTGAIAHADGTPTVLYPALQKLNHDFVTIARELQPLQSLAVYHAGMLPPGAEALPAKSAIELVPPVAPIPYKSPEPVKGVLLGYFGRAPKPGAKAKPSHVLVVNLDYNSEVTVGVRAAGKLRKLDCSTGKWVRLKARTAELHLPRGGGTLVRLN